MIIGGNEIVDPITPDGRTGFDKYGQLVSWTLPDENGTRGYHVRDVRGKICYICNKGWQMTTEDFCNQTIDDRGNLMHLDCLNGYHKINAYETISKALITAGFLFKCEEVPPRYPHSTPWQRITIYCNDLLRSDSGFRIVMGRRKRVWELRLHNVPDVDLYFNDVTNTKGYSCPSKEEPHFGPYFYVHAWSKEDLVDYLIRFHKAIPAAISRSES